MNCYSSNLIEGHNTHPIDIERALHRDFSADIEKRNLPLEAVAHIEVQRLMAADVPRHGGANGRGNLSEQRLAEFAAFFLETCIDQVRFMETLMQPQRLRARIRGWCKAEMADLLGVGDRRARKVTSELLAVGALKADRQRAPLRLNFPARPANT